MQAPNTVGGLFLALQLTVIMGDSKVLQLFAVFRQMLKENPKAALRAREDTF